MMCDEQSTDEKKIRIEMNKDPIKPYLSKEEKQRNEKVSNRII
jgi:hypothetical protein